MMRPKRIILMLLDGLRVDALDSHPVFELLKSRGIWCPNMYTYAPYTTASMHAILTGIYGVRNGVDSYYSASRFRGEICRTLAQYLKDRGYLTVVDINNKHTIPCQGYKRIEEYDEFDNDNRYHLVERHKKLYDEVRNTADSFLLQLHNLKTHTELIQKFREQYADDKEALYYSDPMRNGHEYREYAREMGEYLEAFLTHLDATHFFDEGLLIVYSDHGCSYGEKPGERMYGTYLNDYTTKTFAGFIGASIPAGMRQDRLLRTVDLFPTLLDICGIPIDRTMLELDGISFLEHEQVGARWGYMETAPLGGAYPSPRIPNYHGVVSENYKLLYHSARDELEFFIRSDSGWRQRPADDPDAEEWLLRLCECSPRVNRKWLMKVS